MIRALIFDFDGLILETEVAVLQAWQETYEAHGAQLSASHWIRSIGSTDLFDPYDYLAEQIGRPVDRAAIRTGYRARVFDLLAGISLLPGVLGYLEEAREREMKLAVASSSPRDWVEPHLDQHGLLPFFNCIRCSDDVKRTKPDPELFLSALAGLGVAASEAVVLEDSPNGIRAARAAGIRSVAVPGPLTRDMEFEGAALRLESLADLSLGELLARLLAVPAP